MSEGKNLCAALAGALWQLENTAFLLSAFRLR
jgi:hypothetical protein